MSVANQPRSRQGEAGTGRPESASEITTLRGAVRVFISRRSPLVLLLGLGVALAVRLGASIFPARSFSLRWWDLIAVGVVIGLVPFVEWFVHRFILHAEPRVVGSRTLDFGVGHREHHRHPDLVHRVLLRGVDALIFQVANAGFVLVVLLPPLVVFGVDPVGPVLTGIVTALAALAHYEWAHFLFHTAYRPRTRRYQRLKRNHRRHHWRDERAWLGITSNAGDRLLRTYPPAMTRGRS